jgi:parvulin-like peptidyl-prolyl isomerase
VSRPLCVSLTYCVIAACAQSRLPASGAQSGAGKQLSAGAQCLVDAAEPREVPANAPRRVKVSHLLVRHAELGDAKGATRGREEACLRALSALDALKQGTEWDEVVKRYSDSPDADLGWVTQEDVEPRFAGAAFELEAQQLSYVVETPRGFHVILRRE